MFFPTEFHGAPGVVAVAGFVPSEFTKRATTRSFATTVMFPGAGAVLVPDVLTEDPSSGLEAAMPENSDAQTSIAEFMVGVAVTLNVALVWATFVHPIATQMLSPETTCLNSEVVQLFPPSVSEKLQVVVAVG